MRKRAESKKSEKPDSTTRAAGGAGQCRVVVGSLAALRDQGGERAGDDHEAYEDYREPERSKGLE